MGGQAGPNPGVQGGVQGVWDVARSWVIASRRRQGVCNTVATSLAAALPVALHCRPMVVLHCPKQAAAPTTACAHTPCQRAGSCHLVSAVHC